MIVYLQNEKVTKAPNGLKPLFTELSDFLLIKLNTPIQSVSNTLSDLGFQVFPKTCFRSIYIQFTAPTTRIFI